MDEMEPVQIEHYKINGRNEIMSEGFQLPTPTEHHQRLQPFEGTFKTEVKMWMGPGEPMVSTGTMVSSWQLGGLYLRQEYTGDATDGPFPNFCGEGYWGYNTTANQYEGFWIDIASTAMQNETGSVDADGKVWTMHCEVPSPMGGMMTKRSVITLIDNDHNKMEMYFTGPDGNEMKQMEITYDRV